MIEQGTIQVGPGGLWRATTSTDCKLPDYKVVLTDDRRVFVRGDLRGELVELIPPTPEFRIATHNDCLEVCLIAVEIRWSRVSQ